MAVFLPVALSRSRLVTSDLFEAAINCSAGFPYLRVSGDIVYRRLRDVEMRRG